jgi:uncharacterized protein (TIGR02145 family)
MNRFLPFTLVYLLSIVSFGQINSNDTVVYDLGTMVMIEEYTTDHIIFPVKKSEVEKLGLKGAVKNIQMQTWRWEEYCGHELVKTELYKEIIDFDFDGNRTSCQKTFDDFEVLNYEYERDKNGFIIKAKVSQPCYHLSDGVEYYEYDSLGNVVLERRLEDNGFVPSITKRKFDGDGELIEEERFFSDDFLFFSEKYKRSGKKIKIKDMINGDVWRGTTENSGEIVKLVNRRRFQKKEFTYEFDSVGNWTNKIVFFNGRKVIEEGRQIQYHSLAQNLAEKETVFIKIGTQIWMNKNLDVKTFNNGDVIIHAQCEEEWEKAFLNKTPAWCYCEDGDGDGNLTKDVLYNYFALTDPRGLAPAGYRIATLNDWNVLFNEYGGLGGAFEKLKDPERDDLNTAGRRGYRHGNWLLSESYWWTKDEKKICLAVDNVGKMLIFENQGKDSYFQDGLLLRCVKE